MNILVSQCLLGEPCRYDGQSKPVLALEQLRRAGHVLIPACPEVLGGLSTPRPPAELQADGRVVNREGTDVTAQYELGARRSLDLAEAHGCRYAVLKAKSPSCGSQMIYDGTFSGTLIPGQGVAAQLLAQAGIQVVEEGQIEALLSALSDPHKNPSKAVKR